MTAHLDLDGLSDLLAGEGGPAQVGHLAGCPVCSGALADLEQAQDPVRAALAALPPPEVPPDLAARLDAALLQAREDDLAAARRGGLVALPVGRPADPRHAAVHHRVTRGPSWLLGGAAAVVVVAAVAGVAVGAARMDGGSTRSTTAGTSLRDSPLTASAGTPGVMPVAASSTGTDYAAGPGALAAALPALLRGDAPTTTTATPPTMTSSAAAGDRVDPLSRLRDPAALADCLAGLADASSVGRPVALDYARYAGAPALVVVLPTARADRVDVFVVGAACRDGAEQTLLSTELDRAS